MRGAKAKMTFLRISTKIVVILLTVSSICGSALPLFTVEAQAATTVTRKYGDVNWDGEIDSRDTLRILSHISASTIPKNKKEHPDWILSGDDFRAADVNCDGTIDSRDTLRVQEYIAASTVANIRNKHPEWVRYLQRSFSYNVNLKFSTNKVNVNLNGNKTCTVNITHNYNRRPCTIKLYKQGNCCSFTGKWNPAGNTYTLTITGKSQGTFLIAAELYDTRKKVKVGTTGEKTANILTVNVIKSAAKTAYQKYALTDKQLKKIARLCQQEQGTVKGAKAEASLMANQLETSKVRQKKYGSGANGLYTWVRYGGWFAKAAYWMDHGKVSPNVLAGVRDVLVNGNRVLPLYVDEHDCISDIKSISTGNRKNRKHYIRGKTKVNNRYGAKWTFWCFPDSKSDPFGYTDAAYKAAKKR